MTTDYSIVLVEHRKWEVRLKATGAVVYTGKSKNQAQGWVDAHAGIAWK